VLFISFHYLVFFLVVLLVLDCVRRRKPQHLFLIAASYYFYWAFSSFYVLLVGVSTLVDYYCGRAIHRAPDRRRKRRFLILSLLCQLGLLAYFKYTNFAIDSASAALGALGIETGLHHLDIVLPVGISFYTFMSLSYTLDIYFGRFEPVDSLRTFALYLAFFPHLVAGPILRAADFLPQLRRTIELNAANLRSGFTLILYGLIKKVAVADNLAPFVRATFTGEPTRDSLRILVAIVAFAIQIYCDFSGYTDIAIGSARALGLRFPGNFAHPYFSTNITEFWQRWHMSLSRWLRDYLYIPLGGNRKGRARQCFNLLVTMVLGGLWHGAAWNFVLWGLYQGALLAAHKFLVSERRFMSSPSWDPFKIMVTFYLTCLGWLIFITPDLGRLGYFGKKLLFVDFTPSSFTAFVNAQPLVAFLIPLFFVVHAISYRARDLSRVVAELRTPAWATTFAAGLLVLYLFAAGRQESFIYFQF
jgi:alginate O-acetyltransferase complex protein AlgI